MLSACPRTSLDVTHNTWQLLLTRKSNITKAVLSWEGERVLNHFPTCHFPPPDCPSYKGKHISGTPAEERKTLWGLLQAHGPIAVPQYPHGHFHLAKMVQGGKSEAPPLLVVFSWDAPGNFNFQGNIYPTRVLCVLEDRFCYLGFEYSIFIVILLESLCCSSNW